MIWPGLGTYGGRRAPVLAVSSSQARTTTAVAIHHGAQAPSQREDAAQTREPSHAAPSPAVNATASQNAWASPFTR